MQESAQARSSAERTSFCCENEELIIAEVEAAFSALSTSMAGFPEKRNWRWEEERKQQQVEDREHIR
uniref:Uncharacterized protein n=1 Tax=Lotus japonicus TaxID=34305 RepID=I3SCS9_LOTJA|nr:unknown [Lotus japonicus]